MKLANLLPLKKVKKAFLVDNLTSNKVNSLFNLNNDKCTLIPIMLTRQKINLVLPKPLDIWKNEWIKSNILLDNLNTLFNFKVIISDDGYQFGNISVILTYIEKSTFGIIINYDKTISPIDNPFYDKINNTYKYTFGDTYINLTPFGPYLKIDLNYDIYFKNVDKRIDIKITEI